MVLLLKETDVPRKCWPCEPGPDHAGERPYCGSNQRGHTAEVIRQSLMKSVNCWSCQQLFNNSIGIEGFFPQKLSPLTQYKCRQTERNTWD